MDEIQNPYSPGAGFPPPELAGRHELIKEIEILYGRLTLGRSIQHPVIVGLRGVGKTVLLVKAVEMATEKKFIILHIEAHEGKSLAELLTPDIKRALFELDKVNAAKEKAKRALRVLKSFLNGLKISVGEFDVGLSIEAECGSADSGDLEADLPELIIALGEAAQSAEKPVALIMDELQYLSPKELSALIMAMHKINQKKLPVALLGAGLPQILGVSGNSKSYAERLFKYIGVGALSAEDTKNAIVNPAKSENVLFSDEAVNQIMDFTKCYPYFIQQWSYDTWNIAEGQNITADDVKRAHAVSLKTLDDSFFKVRFERCTPAEKNYMRALAEFGEGAHRSGEIAEKLQLEGKNVSPVRNNLIKKGMIYSPAYGETAFTVPLFDAYMKRAMPVFKGK